MYSLRAVCQIAEYLQAEGCARSRGIWVVRRGKGKGPEGDAGAARLGRNVLEVGVELGSQAVEGDGIVVEGYESEPHLVDEAAYVVGIGVGMQVAGRDVVRQQVEIEHAAVVLGAYAACPRGQLAEGVADRLVTQEVPRIVLLAAEAAYGRLGVGCHLPAHYEQLDAGAAAGVECRRHLVGRREVREGEVDARRGHLTVTVGRDLIPQKRVPRHDGEGITGRIDVTVRLCKVCLLF